MRKIGTHHIASYDVIWWGGTIIWCGGTIIWWVLAIIWWLWLSYDIIWHHMMGGWFWACSSGICFFKNIHAAFKNSRSFCSGFGLEQGQWWESQWRPWRPQRKSQREFWKTLDKGKALQKGKALGKSSPSRAFWKGHQAQPPLWIWAMGRPCHWKTKWKPFKRKVRGMYKASWTAWPLAKGRPFGEGLQEPGRLWKTPKPMRLGTANAKERAQMKRRNNCWECS